LTPSPTVFVNKIQNTDVDNVKSRVRKSKFLQLENQKFTFQKNETFTIQKSRIYNSNNKTWNSKIESILKKNEIYISKIKIYISINGWPQYASVDVK